MGMGRCANIRVVGHVDGRLVCAADQLGFVLHGQHSDFFAILVRRTCRVNDGNVHGTGKALISILARQGELDALAALVQDDTTTDILLDADRLWPFPNSLTPAFGSAVQAVGSVVCGEGVRFAVEVADGSVGDAVRDPANGGAKVCRVVRLIVVLGSEALDNVDAGDREGLQDRTEGQETDFIGGRHGVRLYGRGTAGFREGEGGGGTGAKEPERKCEIPSAWLSWAQVILIHEEGIKSVARLRSFVLVCL